MILYTELLVKKDYSGKSKYDFWTSIKAGDVLLVGVDIDKPWKGKTCQSRMYVKNKFKNTEFLHYPGSVLEYLSKVEYTELHVTTSIEKALDTHGFTPGYVPKANFGVSNIVQIANQWNNPVAGIMTGP